MSSCTATLVGFGALALWSLLALFTAASGTAPPFQLAAMTFAIGGARRAATGPFGPGRSTPCGSRRAVWALGVGGLFGYHALYFAALRLAPPAEAGLVNYLWPLLIVLFSALLPGERLRAAHVAGAFLGFAGVVALTGGRGGLGLAARRRAGLRWRLRGALSSGPAIRCCRAASGRCRPTRSRASVSRPPP